MLLSAGALSQMPVSKVKALNFAHQALLWVSHTPESTFSALAASSGSK
jgi:hypothetical protein